MALVTVVLQKGKQPCWPLRAGCGPWQELAKETAHGQPDDHPGPTRSEVLLPDHDRGVIFSWRWLAVNELRWRRNCCGQEMAWITIPPMRRTPHVALFVAAVLAFGLPSSAQELQPDVATDLDGLDLGGRSATLTKLDSLPYVESE